MSKKVDDMLCFAIYSAGHAFNRIYKPLLDELNVTYPQYLVLVALWADDDQTVSSLGKTLFLESSTLTPLLKRLEAAGYVTRERDAGDERQVRVRLTAAGKKLANSARGISKCVVDASGTSLAALEKLQDELSVIRDNLLRSAEKAS